MLLKIRKIFRICRCCFLFILIITISLITNFSLAQKQQMRYKDKQADIRDPFIALVTDDGRLLKLERKSSGPVEVEGIIYDSLGVSYVFVNKEILGIGDWVGEYQVYKIEKERVVFLKEGEEMEILIKEEKW